MFECKQLGREIKKKCPFRQLLPVQIHRSFPSGVIIDDLIALYFSTFESCFRILHFSSFKREYDSYNKQPEAAKGSFVVILMLVLSIAGTLHHDSQVRKDISSKVQSWISISQTWLSGPLEKDRLTLKGIQMHCLLLISRQVNRVGADLVWISAGSLVRMAMQMGLHQDPNLLRGMDVQQREIRRRLWYTILEINAQSALDSGMTPLIAEVDYTTQPPSNMSDEDLDNAADLQEGEFQYPEDPLKSFQSVLAQSIGLRLNAAVIINSLDKEPSYDEVLSTGEKLSLACTEAADVLNPVAIAENQGSTSHFAHSFCSHLLRRFLLCLHFNYAIRAKANPIYTFSKQVCLEIALEFVSLLSDDLYCKLLVKGGGMFRDIITRGAVMIYLELISGLESGISPFSKTRNRNRQIPLLEDANLVLDYAKNRMYQGETNVKGYVFLSMATARVQALYEGVSSQEATTKAALDSLKLCHEILSQMALEDTVIDIPTNSQPHLPSQTASPDGASKGGFDFLDDPNLNLDSSDWDFFDSMTDENWFNFENK